MTDTLPQPGESPSEAKLADLVADFAERLRSGADPDPTMLLSENAEIAGDLGDCLGGLAAMTELQRELGGSAADAASRSMPEAAGDKPPMGDFELLSELGRGGMGVVWKARQISLDRTVALKMMLSGPHASESDRRRFHAEAEAAARLRHPGIVPIHQVGEIDGRPYFTMEFVAGRSLADRLAEGPLPARTAAEMLRAVAEAIEHAHRNGVLHRDLKPANILLERRSDTDSAAAMSEGVPRVTDFGLAKRLDADVSLTASGEVVGTPSHMAPEQAGAPGAVGPRTDVFALGVVLYAMLTGTRPFQGATPLETILQVLHQEPVPPEKLNWRVPAELSVICLKCLNKEPERRYGAAQELADDLTAFLEGRPIKARPDGMFGRLARALARERHPEVMAVSRSFLLAKAWMSVLVCGLVTALQLAGRPEWAYLLLLAGGPPLVMWRPRATDESLAGRQLGTAWMAFLFGCMVTVGINVLMTETSGLRPLALAPIVAVLAGVANLMAGDLISGWFHFAAVACFVAAPLMVLTVPYDFLILGLVMYGSMVLPGRKSER